jgi:hypothetical protein
MQRSDRSGESFDPRPESAMGGAGDMGAHGHHPASSSEAAREGLSPLPADAIGDAIVERRHHHDAGYAGPERRVAMR